ncbi:3'-N-debenzoyl-2'-deoxytaxol N-benzoyltransferase [Quillaja saponaria]|uniref:3'-N-debenzoyl-2'-deoxytaxol N-benzoyltransferase n=1 Tax=Quillaja saponaria TaxID=32244 RepID=A0AAD7L3Q9_QUISA|nr:3'-N-debenzoyl-2'-deoxytaxol N-benzoyltransferase [Quillaja saponaria]
MVALSVIRSRRGLVRPAEQTPSTTLSLSPIDSLPSLRCYVQSLHVFKHGPDAATVIREALSRALVHYYPVAGRIKESDQGYLQVECSADDGVWFVEASADYTLESVNYFGCADSQIPSHNLFPDSTPKTECKDHLVQMQVTQFACGGFVIGLLFHHSLFDGIGAAQFLNAIGELARNHENLSVIPVWHRDFLPCPHRKANVVAASPNQLPPPMPYKLEHANIDTSLDHIQKLKQEFHEITGQICSTFEIMAAKLWICRTRAINLKPTTQVKLSIVANCRHLMNPPLPKGFYGNGFIPITITSSCDSLLHASLFDVVKMIQAAKKNLPIEIAKYLYGDNKLDGTDNPYSSPYYHDYTVLIISDWKQLGFDHVDYQWGPPVHVCPLQEFVLFPFVYLRPMPLATKGIRSLTWCVDEAHRQSFLDQMGEL